MAVTISTVAYCAEYRGYLALTARAEITTYHAVMARHRSWSRLVIATHVERRLKQQPTQLLSFIVDGSFRFVMVRVGRLRGLQLMSQVRQVFPGRGEFIECA